MGQRCWLVIAALWVGSLIGCARGNLALLHQELRLQERRVAQLEGDLSRSRFDLQACRRENETLRQQVQKAGQQAVLPEQAAALFRLQELTLHGLLTGGVDTDGFPGDDQLVVLAEPRDPQGDLLKAPGSITIELYDMALDEPKRRIGFWQFHLDETLKAWYSGVFASGYRFELPWQSGYPQHEQLMLHVEFQTPDGRRFSTTKQIRVQMLPAQAPADPDGNPQPPEKPTPSPDAATQPDPDAEAPASDEKPQGSSSGDESSALPVLLPPSPTVSANSSVDGEPSPLTAEPRLPISKQ